MVRLKISSKHDLDKDLKMGTGIIIQPNFLVSPPAGNKTSIRFKMPPKGATWWRTEVWKPWKLIIFGCNENTESCSVPPRMHVQQAAIGFQQMRLMVPSDILCFHVALEAQKCFLLYLSNVLPPAVMCDRKVRGSLGIREEKTSI